jgi:hypothetical protein
MNRVIIDRWQAHMESGRSFMDASPHTIQPEFLSQRIRYTFEVFAPPGLHPQDVLRAIEGTPVTQSEHVHVAQLQVEVGKVTRERDTNQQELDRVSTELAAERTKVAGLERELRRVRGENERRSTEDRDNKARLDALALLGTTVSDRGLDKLIQVELDTWLRGLDDFNMTGAEAEELTAMLKRLATEVFSRAEVLRDRKRCAVLLESLQRERDRGRDVEAKEVEEGGDQLF